MLMDNYAEKNAFKALSFFSGAMGFDLGIQRAGFKTIFANEIDPLAVKTIKRNLADIEVSNKPIETLSCTDIEAQIGHGVRNIPLVVGGPPCQAFSVIGKRKGLADSRGTLVYEFIRLLAQISPDCFIMENVRGLHSMPLASQISDAPSSDKNKGTLFKDILTRFESIGYHVDCFLVNAVNYGVSQIRERLICIGNKYNLKAVFPSPLYSNRDSDKLPPFRTLGDVIGRGFVDSDPTLMNFSPRKLHYLNYVPPGGNWRNMPVEIQKESMGNSWYLKGGRSAFWRRLSFSYPSPTIVTMPNHASTSLCHPDELRALTVGECATIQGFPCDWIFEGSAADKYKQIGNAVPPKLGEIAGKVVFSMLENIRNNQLLPLAPSPSTVEHIRPHVRTRIYWKNGQIPDAHTPYYLNKRGGRQLSLLE